MNKMILGYRIQTYIVYKFICKLFGHTHSCCDRITDRCSKCKAEGRILP